MAQNRQGAELTGRNRAAIATPLLLALCLTSAGCADIRLGKGSLPTDPDVTTIARELTSAIPLGARVAVRPLEAATDAVPAPRAKVIDRRLADSLAQAAEGRFSIVAREDAAALWDETMTRPREAESQILQRFVADVLVVGHVERMESTATVSYRAVDLGSHAVLAVTEEQLFAVPPADMGHSGRSTFVEAVGTSTSTPFGRWLPIGNVPVPAPVVASPALPRSTPALAPEPALPVSPHPITLQSRAASTTVSSAGSVSSRSTSESDDLGAINMIVAAGIGFLLLRAFRRQTARAK